MKNNHAEAEPRRDGMIEQRIQDLKTIRDTLRVRIHLAGKEASDLFLELEKRWREIESKASAVQSVSEEAAHHVKEASELVLDEIHDGYRRLKALLG